MEQQSQQFQKSQKTYIGNGKVIADKFNSGSIRFTMKQKDLDVLKQQMSVSLSKGIDTVSFFVCRRKEVGKFGATHYGVMDNKEYSRGGDRGGDRGGERGFNGNNNQGRQEQGQSNNYNSSPSAATQEHRYANEDLPDLPQ